MPFRREGLAQPHRSDGAPGTRAGHSPSILLWTTTDLLFLQQVCIMSSVVVRLPGTLRSHLASDTRLPPPLLPPGVLPHPTVLHVLPSLPRTGRRGSSCRSCYLILWATFADLLARLLLRLLFHRRRSLSVASPSSTTASSPPLSNWAPSPPCLNSQVRSLKSPPPKRRPSRPRPSSRRPTRRSRPRSGSSSASRTLSRRPLRRRPAAKVGTLTRTTSCTTSARR